MKQLRRIEDLAIFGGPPAFAEPLHVGRPNIVHRAALMERLNDILDRRWLSNDGPYVRQFEQRLADLVGVKHCLAICNGTVALQIAVRALGLTGEVIVPAMTFIATAHALEWVGVRPVFCDIDPVTYTLDPARVEEAITPQTSGILGVHVFGHVCDVNGLADLARRHGLALIYDAAHAVGCSLGGRMVGGFGDAEVFSFHATKFLHSFEGGAIATQRDDVAERVRLMRNFGFAGYDTVVEVGTNGKMHEVSAAMGLTSLEGFDEIVMANRANFQWYQRALAGIPGLRLVSYGEGERQNFQYVVVEVDRLVTGIGREEIVKILWAEQVLARRYFYPGCHRMEPYRSRREFRPLPVTDAVAEQLMTLPTGTAITADDINAVCAVLRMVVAHGPQIAQRLAERASVSVPP